MSPLKKTTSTLIILSIILSTILSPVFAIQDPTVLSSLSSIQNTDTNLPFSSDLAKQKGNIWYLLAKIFWKYGEAGNDGSKSGKIKPDYIDYTGISAWSVSGSNASLSLTGNVGIGTTSPSEKLEVTGNIKYSGNLINGTTTITSTELSYLDSSTSNIQTQINTLSGNISSKVGIFGVGTINNISKFNGLGQITNSSIYDDGTNVGIGTTSPTYKLDVSGNIRASGTIYGNVDNSDKLDGYHGSNYIGLNGNSYYQFNTRLQSTGAHGLYFPSSGAGTHWYPNTTSTYGSFVIEGAKSGYYGILFGASTAQPNLMWDGSANGGFYMQNLGKWAMYYNNTSSEWYINGSSGNKVWHAGNDGAGSGLDSDSVDGRHVGAGIGNISYYNDSNGYLYLPSRMNVDGGGIYSGINGAHFYPNQSSSYGTWQINGSRNGRNGLNFNGGETLMMNANSFGFYRDGVGWDAYFSNGIYYGNASNGSYYINPTGNSYIAGSVGIGTASATSKLTVAGVIESTSGGIKFPDGTVQTSAAAGGFRTVDVGNKYEQSSRQCVTVDLRNECSGPEGCTLRLNLQHEIDTYDQVHTINESIYIEGDLSNNHEGGNSRYGWTKQLGGGDYSWITGTSRQYTIFNPWDWIRMFNYYHSNCYGYTGAAFADPYTFSIMIHPHITGHILIKKGF